MVCAHQHPANSMVLAAPEANSSFPSLGTDSIFLRGVILSLMPVGFPAPKNHAPSGFSTTRQWVCFIGCLTALALTRHQNGPSPPDTDTRTPNALVAHTSRLPSISAHTS